MWVFSQTVQLTTPTFVEKRWPIIDKQWKNDNENISTYGNRIKASKSKLFHLCFLNFLSLHIFRRLIKNNQSGNFYFYFSIFLLYCTAYTVIHMTFDLSHIHSKAHTHHQHYPCDKLFDIWLFRKLNLCNSRCKLSCISLSLLLWLYFTHSLARSFVDLLAANNIKYASIQ